MLRRIGVLASLAVVAAVFAGVPSAQATNHPAVGDGAVCIFGGLSGSLDSTATGTGDGIPNIIPDLQSPLGVLHDVEHGSYEFHTVEDANCVVKLGNTVTPVDDAKIDSDGYYDNIACGTGFAHDLDSSGTWVRSASLGIAFGTDPDNSEHSDPAGYEIPFAGGVGPLLVGPDGKPALAGATESLPDAPAAHGGAQHGPDGEWGDDPPSTGETDDFSDAHGDVISNYVGTGLVQITPGAKDPLEEPLGPSENCVEPPGFGGNANEDGDTDEFLVTGFLSGVKVQTGADGDL